MLAKALAAESRCFFINVTASAIMSKWYGDANRFIRAIFTLAAKLEPAVIFIGALQVLQRWGNIANWHHAMMVHDCFSMHCFVFAVKRSTWACITVLHNLSLSSQHRWSPLPWLPCIHTQTLIRECHTAPL